MLNRCLFNFDGWIYNFVLYVHIMIVSNSRLIVLRDVFIFHDNHGKYCSHARVRVLLRGRPHFLRQRRLRVCHRHDDYSAAAAVCLHLSPLIPSSLLFLKKKIKKYLFFILLNFIFIFFYFIRSLYVRYLRHLYRILITTEI